LTCRDVEALPGSTLQGQIGPASVALAISSSLRAATAGLANGLGATNFMRQPCLPYLHRALRASISAKGNAELKRPETAAHIDQWISSAGLKSPT
jgi:hypothetical protein